MATETSRVCLIIRFVQVRHHDEVVWRLTHCANACKVEETGNLKLTSPGLLPIVIC